jgi:hypothetical protein
MADYFVFSCVFSLTSHRELSELKSYLFQEIATSQEGSYNLERQTEVLLAMTIPKSYPYPHRSRDIRQTIKHPASSGRTHTLCQVRENMCSNIQRHETTGFGQQVYFFASRILVLGSSFLSLKSHISHLISHISNHHFLNRYYQNSFGTGGTEFFDIFPKLIFAQYRVDG